MSMWFNYICRQKDFFHRISRIMGEKENIASCSYEYENRSISKYLEAAKKLNIEIIPLGFRMYELRKGNITRRIMTDRTIDKENPVSCRLCCNKYLTYKVLEDKGIKHFPKHQLYTYNDIDKVCADFIDWNCPVVIKPCTGTNSGTGVTVNIKTIKDLKNAITESFVFNRENFLMEQYIKGSHFRVLTLKGDFIACSQRIPARIIGNGRDSIKKLIDKENQKRNTDKSGKALYPIVVDNEVKRKLKSLNKTMGSVLGKNEEIFVKDIINLHSGGEVRSIENVSEDIKDICKRITQILDIYLAGFDIITSDISKAFNETNGVINEVNTAPGIEGLYQKTNSGVFIDVAETVLKDMFNL